MAVVASDTYNQRNQGVPTAESVKAWVDIARAAKAAGIRANVMISSAFGCPFEGEVPVRRVLDLVEQVMEGDPVELGLADSIGVGVPSQVRDLIGAVREKAPGVPIRCHFHNTRNTGIANAQAALDAGVASLDASIGGIGGCPFAPAATGNIPTDDLLYMLDRSGVRDRRFPGADHCHEPVAERTTWPGHPCDAAQGRNLSADRGNQSRPAGELTPAGQDWHREQGPASAAFRRGASIRMVVVAESAAIPKLSTGTSERPV